MRPPRSPLALLSVLSLCGLVVVVVVVVGLVKRSKGRGSLVRFFGPGGLPLFFVGAGLSSCMESERKNRGSGVFFFFSGRKVER